MANGTRRPLDPMELAKVVASESAQLPLEAATVPAAAAEPSAAEVALPPPVVVKTQAAKRAVQYRIAKEQRVSLGGQFAVLRVGRVLTSEFVAMHLASLRVQGVQLEEFYGT